MADQDYEAHVMSAFAKDLAPGSWGRNRVNPKAYHDVSSHFDIQVFDSGLVKIYLYNTLIGSIDGETIMIDYSWDSPMTRRCCNVIMDNMGWTFPRLAGYQSCRSNRVQHLYNWSHYLMIEGSEWEFTADGKINGKSVSYWQRKRAQIKHWKRIKNTCDSTIIRDGWLELDDRWVHFRGRKITNDNGSRWGRPVAVVHDTGAYQLWKDNEFIAVQPPRLDGVWLMTPLHKSPFFFKFPQYFNIQNGKKAPFKNGATIAFGENAEWGYAWVERGMVHRDDDLPAIKHERSKIWVQDYKLYRGRGRPVIETPVAKVWFDRIEFDDGDIIETHDYLRARPPFNIRDVAIPRYHRLEDTSTGNEIVTWRGRNMILRELMEGKIPIALLERKWEMKNGGISVIDN